MNPEELHIFIDELIRKKRPFAIYRIPGDTKLRLVQHLHGPVSIYKDIHSLNGKKGFVIAPFLVTAKCPILLIEGNEEEIPANIVSMCGEDTFAKKDKYPPVSSDYEKHYHTFIQSLREGKLDKLVLSRRAIRNKDRSFSPATAFLKACRRYIRSYVYICHTPESGTWLGSTPEIILSGEGNKWYTVALAGTQPLQNGELPRSWNKKNVEEQRLVAEYIYNQLSSFGIEAREEGPYTVRAGELAHLKSDFGFALQDGTRLGDLLNLLHPTPAVCGLPKEEASLFIRENEEYDRRYYSGFIGYLNGEGKTDIYVNLRCMEIGTDGLTLYAGGGLLSSSTLEEEWQETEDKLYTMRAII